jgi:hypothetical protein
MENSDREAVLQAALFDIFGGRGDSCTFSSSMHHGGTSSLRDIDGNERRWD